MSQPPYSPYSKLHTQPSQSLPSPDPDPQKLLLSHFLLIIENESLHEQLKNRQTGNKNQETVLRRIQEIQLSMGEGLKFKESKIGELNRKIREMHGVNQGLCGQLQGMKRNYKVLQETYIKQVSELTLKLTTQTPQPQPQCDHPYQIRVLEHEKQQLNAQLMRCNNVTIKQLQADIEILNKENQSYMVAINNYRLDEKKFREGAVGLEERVKKVEEEKLRLEEELKKYCELVNQNALSKTQWQRSINTLKQQTQKLSQKLIQTQKSHKSQLETLQKSHSLSFAQSTHQVHSLQLQLSTLRSQLQKSISELQKKSQKLKEYDDQYTLYINKMNGLQMEMNALKMENARVKEKLQKMVQEEKMKGREQCERLGQGYRVEVQRLRIEFTERVKEVEGRSRAGEVEEIKQVEKQMAELKEEFQMLLQDQETKCKKVQQQRDNAIKQWQELLQQMTKQKTIINSLQKQIQTYRKQNRNYMIAYSTFQSQSQCQSHERSLTGQPSTSRQPAKDYESQIIKLVDNRRDVEYLESRRQRDSQRERERDSQRESLGERKSYDHLMMKPRSKSITPTNNCLKEKKNQENVWPQYESTKETAERKLQSYYSKNQGERPSLGCKRKDGAFKKYEYLRTKTQQSLQNNYEYIPSKPTPFFAPTSQSQTRKYYQSPNPVPALKQQQWSSSQPERPQRLIKSSSLQKVDYDKNLQQIQQYLSFDVSEVKGLSRSASDRKITSQPTSARLKTQGMLYDSTPQKNILIEKINNIASSSREQNQLTKQNKFYNFCKRPPGQNFGRPARVEKKVAVASAKENINEIIHRKCQYISER